MKDPGHPCLDEENSNVYFISRWNQPAMHKWVLLIKFLSKKYIHAYCCFVLEKGKSPVSDCSFPRAFPFIWLSDSHFPAHRMLPRKPGTTVSHSIFYSSQAKAVTNSFKQYFLSLYSALGPAFLLRSGNSFRSISDFCAYFLPEDFNPWKCLFKLQELVWVLCNCGIPDYIQSTVHCLSLVHPHLPVLTRYK